MAKTLNRRRGSDPKESVTRLWGKVILGVVLLFAAPPIGIIYFLVIGKSLFTELKNQGIVQTDVEGKPSVNWNKARQSGSRSARELRAYGEDTARRFKMYVSESDIMDERMPRRTHGHNPVSYSYGKCSQERRLEQLKALKEAGLLNEVEYQQRRQKIMSQR